MVKLDRTCSYLRMPEAERANPLQNDLERMAGLEWIRDRCVDVVLAVGRVVRAEGDGVAIFKLNSPGLRGSRGAV